MNTVLITALDQEGRGIARIDGKAVFVEGALVGERVTIEIYRKRPTYELARATGILRASPSRVAPLCPHFGVCGGCSLQHLDAAAQVAAKQRVLEDALWHIGRVRAGELLAPIHGPAWGYRQRARLSVRHVPKKGGVLVGFHERKSSFITDMRTCPVLPPHISSLLPALRELIGGLSMRDRLPQIELAVGDDADDGTGNEVLVLRNLDAPTTDDERALADFADRHGVRLYLQPKGPDTVQAFHPPRPHLGLCAPRFRRAHRVSADRLHAGQRRDESHAGAPRGRHARADGRAMRSPTSSADWATSRLPIARRGARRRRRRGQRGAGAPGASQRASQRSRAIVRASSPPICSRRRRRASRRWARSTRRCSIRRAKARSRWSRRCRKHGCRASSMSRAIRLRSPATRRCWCTSAASRCARRGSSTCSRTRRTSSRSRCSPAEQPPIKRAPEGALWGS